MSDQSFLVVPMPQAGQSGGTDTTGQQVSPEMQAKVSQIANNVLNGQGHESQSSSSLGSTSQGGAGNHSKTDQAPDTVRKLLNDPSSLYKLINWEDPRVTLGSLSTVVAFLTAARYFHIMQWIFKASSIVLGVVSLVEVASRSSTGKSVTMQMKPEKYYKVPEPTLNRVFAEMQEAVQFLVVQAQKLIYGENPTNTVAAFVTSIASYWLIKIFTPWQLAVIAVPIVYTLPLLLSPQKKQQIRGVANDASNKVSSSVSDLKHKAQNYDLQQTTNNAADKVSATASDMKNSNAGQNIRDTTQNFSNKISSTASDITHKVQNQNPISENTVNKISNSNPFSSNKEQAANTDYAISSTSSYGSDGKLNSKAPSSDLSSQFYGHTDSAVPRKPYATHTHDLAPAEEQRIPAERYSFPTGQQPYKPTAGEGRVAL